MSLDRSSAEGKLQFKRTEKKAIITVLMLIKGENLCPDAKDCPIHETMTKRAKTGVYTRQKVYWVDITGT